ncbi:MAG TPA: glycosyltransferase family 4 protein [Bacteroidales bacterium]|nr:glycosyltransferase family 4 protein [Bacteroidales bacterium]
MRLLILNYEYPPLGGGAGVITQNIAEGLASRRHQISVITTWYEGEPEEITSGNLRIIRLKSKRKKLFQSNPVEMLSWMFAAKKFLNKHLLTEKYDLCFANFSLPGGEVAYSIKLKYKIPYVLMSHGHDIPWFMPEEMMWYHAFTYHWIHTICLQSERNYVQSEDMKKNIDSFLGRSFNSKNKVIYNGWNSKLFSPDYSQRLKKFTILFIGRLVKQKDPLSFLNAMRILKSKISDFEVHILGDGKLKNKMEKFVYNNNLKDTVIFKSWLTKSEMLNEYHSASLVVLPSLNEGMSIATLEALACGQYVIATKVSNNESLIIPGLNGDFILKKNPSDIADKVLDFYKNKFLLNYTIPQEHLNKYHENFEWNKIIDEYEKDLVGIVEQIKLT